MSKNCASCKVFALAFFKKLADSKGRALVALRRERNHHGLFFLISFFFWLEQERAQWAMKRVRSTEKTRSVECDLAFKATMFLTVSLCQKKKRYRKNTIKKSHGLPKQPVVFCI